MRLPGLDAGDLAGADLDAFCDVLAREAGGATAGAEARPTRCRSEGWGGGHLPGMNCAWDANPWGCWQFLVIMEKCLQAPVLLACRALARDG
jgi:hypothetical protein